MMKEQQVRTSKVSLLCDVKAFMLDKLVTTHISTGANLAFLFLSYSSLHYLFNFFSFFLPNKQIIKETLIEIEFMHKQKKWILECKK